MSRWLTYQRMLVQMDKDRAMRQRHSRDCWPQFFIRKKHDDGLVEIKCPNTAKHIETLLNGGIDGRYIKQMHWQMICTGRKWCDFISFDPRMPGSMQLHIERVTFDVALAKELEAEARTFLGEVSDTVERLDTKYRQVAA